MSVRITMVVTPELIGHLRAEPPFGWTILHEHQLRYAGGMWLVDLQSDNAPAEYDGHAVEGPAMRRNSETGNVTVVMSYLRVPPRKPTSAEREHVARWTDDEWLHVISTVNPHADLAEGIDAVDQLRNGGQP